MLRTHVKVEDNEPSLPTPSPSPPRSCRRLPVRREPAELKEQHLAKARQAAERVRLEYLAQALQSSGAGSKAEDGDLSERSGMQRFSYMFEQEENGRKVAKRVTVIVPAATPPPASTLDKRPLAVLNDKLEQRRPAFTLQYQNPAPPSLSRTAMWAQGQQRRLAGISEDATAQEVQRREDDDAEREVKRARLTLSERRGGRRFAPLCLV
ncbi:hypothetical protein JCM10295v2_003345 [Rhodotorula toruloides]